MKNEILVQVSGPVGSGKTTICRLIQMVLNHSKIGNKFVGSELLGEDHMTPLFLSDRIDAVAQKTSVKILSRQIKRLLPDVNGSIHEYIAEINGRNTNGNIVFLFPLDDIEKIPTKQIFQSSLVVQKMNIKNLFYVHKSRYGDSSVVLTREKLIEHIQDYYEY